MPGGVDLFPEMAASVCQAPKPVRRNRSRERGTRIARIRIRNRQAIHLRAIQAHSARGMGDDLVGLAEKVDVGLDPRKSRPVGHDAR